MAERGVKTRNNLRWTEARYFSFIRSALRSAFTRWPVKFDVMNKNRRTVEGKRHRYEYQCAECGEWFQAKEVQVDHIEPCGSLKTFEDLPKFTSTLFCEEDNLQVICKPCHKIKTAEERANAKDTTR